MKNKSFFTFLFCLVLATYTQAYTPEYDNNGQLTLLTADLSRNGDSAADLVYGIIAFSGSTITGNTASNNGSLATSTVYGIYADFGSTVTGNTAFMNGYSAYGGVFGIFLVGNNLVDQNTVYNNFSTNMNVCGTCTFGINHAP